MEEMHQDKPSLSFLQRVYAKSCDVLSNSAEYFASFAVGQSVLRQTDRFLWTIEKCAEWSVPTTPTAKQSTSNGTFGKSGPLVRPLPWLLFLPMLLFLRVIRFSLNIGAMLIGMETVKPSKMVRFVQVRRRRIRALKFLGLRRIRQKKMEKENQLTWKETFYSIMSRAMCFRVTNSDLYEQITVKKESEDNEQSSSTSKTKRKPNGKDLKRKYIEILKNNYYEWEDVEDDEELIDRITQLAEDDDDDDSDFVPAEDSATEDDSMSDAEEDIPIAAAAASASGSGSASASIISNTPGSSLQRLASQGSLSNATIEEENENEEENTVDADSDSTTVSANSEDESSQHMSAGETPKKEEPIKKQDTQQLPQPNTDVTSDEYYSPVNSISTSPEPKTDEELIKCNKQNNKFDDKKESENFINSETKQETDLNASSG